MSHQRVRFTRAAWLGGALTLILPLLALAGLWETGAVVRAWYFGAYGLLHLCLGCLALLYIGDMTGGRWNERLVEFFDQGRRLIPVALLLLAPAFFFLEEIFPWTTQDLQGGEGFSKQDYLSPGLFLFRMAAYGIVYLVMSLTAGAAVRNIRRRRAGERLGASAWSAGGLVAYAFVGIFASTDAVMSLAPEWFSSGLSVILMSSQAMMAYSLALAARLVLVEEGRETAAFFGNLLLATLMFWVYVAFVQFLIIWMGNLSEDITFYLARSSPGWVALSIFMAVFIFALPLIALMNTEIKRRRTRLSGIALLLFLGQCLYLAWVILPAWSADLLQTLLAAAALAGFVGVSLAWCGFALRKEEP